MGSLLRDFMRVLMTCPWIGRMGINEPWRRGDRAICRHGACFPPVDRPLEVPWAGSQPDGSKGVEWLWATTLGHTVGTGCMRCYGFGPPDLLALQYLSTRGLCVPSKPLMTAEQVLPSNAFPSLLEENINSAALLPFLCTVPH